MKKNEFLMMYLEEKSRNVKKSGVKLI